MFTLYAYSTTLKRISWCDSSTDLAWLKTKLSLCSEGWIEDEKGNRL